MVRFTVYYLIGLFLFFLSIFVFRSSYLSWLLSTDFHIPISCQEIHLFYPKVAVKNFQVGNPQNFEKTHSLAIKNLSISLPSSYDPFVIDLIELDGVDVFVIVNEQKGNNWSQMLENHFVSKNQRKYLIKKCLLKNVRVHVQKELSKKDYPLLEEVVIENISNDSGYTYDHLERAIAQAIVKKIFPLYGLQTLIQTPLKIIPKIFPFLNK